MHLKASRNTRLATNSVQFDVVCLRGNIGAWIKKANAIAAMNIVGFENILSAIWMNGINALVTI